MSEPAPYDNTKPWPYWGWREKVAADLHAVFYRLNLAVLAHPERVAAAVAGVDELRQKLESET